MGRREDEERDIRIMDERADVLNAEAEEFLAYQVDLLDEDEPETEAER